jgi:hypothetical protein
MSTIAGSDPYQELGVERDAAPDAVHAAFRRLARECHPDQPGGGDPQRFIRIVSAYRALQAAMRATDRSASFGTCPRCGAAEELLTGPGGHALCAACWLNRRRRMLMGPLAVMRRHWRAVAAYLASLILLSAYGWSGEKAWLAGSLACALLGLVLLAAEVLRHVLSRGEPGQKT